MIKHIEINNFGPFDVVKIDVSKFNIFYGKSLQGKTSILEAIRWVIIGGNDDYYIKNGASTAEVILHSDNGSKIERRLSRGGASKLFIYDKSDIQVQSPQKLLNTLYNPFLFSPTDLLKMKDKDLNIFISDAISKRLKLSEEQIKIYGLQEVDLNDDPVSAIKAHYDILFKERTDVNRFVKQAFNQSLAIIPNITQEDINKIEVTINHENNKISQIKSQNAKIEIAKKNLAIKVTTENNIFILEKQIQEIENSIIENVNYEVVLNEKKDALKKSQEELIKGKEHYRILSEGLKKIDSSQIKCPLHESIICSTSMTDNVKSMKTTLKDIEVKGKKDLSLTQELEIEIKNLEQNYQASKDLKNKKLELERSKSLLSQLDIVDASPIDVTALEEMHSKNIDQLAKMKISLEMSKLSGLQEMQIRQEDLNAQLDNLNKLIKEVIPSMLTLNVKNIVLSKDGVYYQGLPLSRHGDSLKLRICTAILKDLFPTGNLFCMDRSECIDQEELQKYVNYYSKENNNTQYFMTVVGDIKFSAPVNTKLFKIEGFKVI